MRGGVERRPRKFQKASRKEMAKEKNLSKRSPPWRWTSQWYTDVVKKAELIEYTGVKGCLALRPYGYAIGRTYRRSWTKIQGARA